MAKTTLACPCGALIQGDSEDTLIERAQDHLRTEHPGREYDRDQILALAY